MVEFEFPRVELRTNESLTVTLRYSDDDSVELVDYRVRPDPVREAAKIAALEQELEEL